MFSENGKMVLIREKALTFVDKWNILATERTKKMLKANFLKGKDAKP